MNQDKADDPNLADLKKLLRRLEKIDPEGSDEANRNGSDSDKSASDKARKLQRAVSGAAQGDAGEADGLLTLQSRKPGRDLEVVASPELPVIVKSQLPAVTSERAEPAASGTLRTVLIASVTATVVSALAAAGTFYWLRETQSVQTTSTPTVVSEAPSGPSGSDAPRDMKSAAMAETAAAVGVVDPANANQAVAANSLDVMSVPQPRPATPGSFAGQAAGVGVVAGIAGPDTEAEAEPAAGLADGATNETPDRAAADAGEAGATASAKSDGGPAGIVAESEDPGSGESRSAAANAGPTTDRAAADAPRLETATGDIAADSPAKPELPAPSDAATVVAEAEEVAAAGPETEPLAERRAAPAGEVVAMLDGEANSPVAGQNDSAAESGSNGTALSPSNEAAEVSEPATTALPSLRARPALAGGAVRHPAEIDLPVGEPVSLPLQIADDAPDLAGHYLIVSGLKRGARFNGGIEILYDTWRLDLPDLPNLELTVPEGFARRLHVTIDVRRADGTSRENSTMIVNLPARSLALAPAADESGLSDAVRKRVDEAEVHIDNGNLRAARLLFERSASDGSARAALLLAATYDPALVGSFETSPSPEPDAARARRWYQRSIDLGSEAAADRLKNLPPS